MSEHHDGWGIRSFLDEIESMESADVKLRMELTAAAHRDFLDYCTRNDHQFFSSAAAKHRYVATKLRVDSSSSRALARLLNLGSTQVNSAVVIDASLPPLYLSLLRHLIDVAERQEQQQQHKDHEHASSAIEPPSDSSHAVPRVAADEALDAVQDSLQESLLDSLHRSLQQTQQQTLFEPNRQERTTIRVVVTALGERQRTANGEIHVLHCCTEDGKELRVALTGMLVDDADTVWEGAIVHITEARILDDERVITTADSMCVVEPDALVDVTDIAECFQQRGAEPALSLIRRWTQSPASEAVVMGSIINSCFDDIILHPEKDFDSMYRDACAARPLSFIAAVSTERRDALKDTVRDHVERLRALMQQVPYSRAIVEPSFISPVFGLQGRLDVLLEHADNPLHKTIIELKSGSAPGVAAAPVESSASDSSAARTPTSPTPAAHFGTPRSRVWKNHEAQIACYHLLLQSAFPGRYGDSRILYSKTPDEPMRNVDVTPALLRSVIHCRNQILRLEYELRSKNFRSLARICDTSLPVPSFMTEAQQNIRAVFRNDDPDIALHAQVFLYLLLRESYEQRIGGSGASPGFSALWKSTATEKTLRNSLLSGLRLLADEKGFEQGILSFSRTAEVSEASVFRVGDIVVVYPVDETQSRKVYHGVQLKGTIRRIDATRVVVRLRSQQPCINANDIELSWHCEPDYMESSHAATLASFMTVFRAPERKRNVILGRAMPEHSQGQEVIEATAPEASSSSHTATSSVQLDDHQRHLLQLAMSAKDYFLLQGPPGTGKTSVMLRSMVEHLLGDENETVLIAAYTNRAVDEICRTLKHAIAMQQIVRMGRSENTEHPELLFQTMVREHGPEGAEQRLRSARVVVGTVTFLNSNPELFSCCRFSTAIVDEAAQILEPHLAGILAKVQRFILIGDERQLPPVLSVPEGARRIRNSRMEELGITDVQTSLFERLLQLCIRNGWGHAYGMLTHQGRMHQDICALPSDLFYDGKLISFLPRQVEALPRVPVTSEERAAAEDGDERSNDSGSDQFLYSGSAKRILAHRCVFIDSGRNASRLGKNNSNDTAVGLAGRKIHIPEARICARLAELFMAECAAQGKEWNSMRLGIITPFRAQIQQIQRLLSPLLLNTVTVDTVERYQGSERDIIILSTAVNSPSELASIQSISYFGDQVVDRKLNVALTRARERFILLGHEYTLRRVPHYARLLDRLLRVELPVDEYNYVTVDECDDVPADKHDDAHNID